MQQVHQLGPLRVAQVEWHVNSQHTSILPTLDRVLQSNPIDQIVQEFSPPVSPSTNGIKEGRYLIGI